MPGVGSSKLRISVSVGKEECIFFLKNSLDIFSEMVHMRYNHAN